MDSFDVDLFAKYLLDDDFCQAGEVGQFDFTEVENGTSDFDFLDGSGDFSLDLIASTPAPNTLTPPSTKTTNTTTTTIHPGVPILAATSMTPIEQCALPLQTCQQAGVPQNVPGIATSQQNILTSTPEMIPGSTAPSIDPFALPFLSSVMQAAPANSVPKLVNGGEGSTAASRLPKPENRSNAVQTTTTTHASNYDFTFSQPNNQAGSQAPVVPNPRVVVRGSNPTFLHADCVAKPSNQQINPVFVQQRAPACTAQSRQSINPVFVPQQQVATHALQPKQPILPQSPVPVATKVVPAPAPTQVSTATSNSQSIMNLLRSVNSLGNAVQPNAVSRKRPTPIVQPILPNGQVPELTPTGRIKKRKTPAQKERRRERNRVLAKQTRDKKKDYLETLQKEVLALQRENQKLKVIVKTQVDDSDDLLNTCNAMERVPQSVIDACHEMEDADPEKKFSMVTRMKKAMHSFVITDPSLADNPVVFASGDFLKLTGYDRTQVLGRNCRFLQGPATSRAKVDKIRRALHEDEDVTVTLINYRADGTPFWNRLFVAALRNSDNQVVNYMSVTIEVACPDPGDPEHGKPLPEVVRSESPQSVCVQTAAVG